MFVALQCFSCKAPLFDCFYVPMLVLGLFFFFLQKEKETFKECKSVLVFHPFLQHIHVHILPLSCKTTWLPAASPPTSTAARDLARLIIFLLIECGGTLQGWVIKLMQRMFVSTVYLSTAKRYIRHTAHEHKRTQTHTHMQGY